MRFCVEKPVLLSMWNFSVPTSQNAPIVCQRRDACTMVKPVGRGCPSLYRALRYAKSSRNNVHTTPTVQHPLRHNTPSEMPTFATNRYAALAATSLGYKGLSVADYRKLCAEMRVKSEMDFSDGRRAWHELSGTEKTAVLTRLRKAYPGVRNPHAVLRAFSHMLSAFKAESHRVPRLRPDTTATESSDQASPAASAYAT
jgi:hypothetical protein